MALRGTARGDRQRPQPQMASAITIQQATHMAKYTSRLTDEGREFFRKTCELQLALGLLDQSTVDTVFWCAWWRDRVFEIMPAFQAWEPEPVTDKMGQTVRYTSNPWLPEMDKAMKKYSEFSTKLFISPMDRQKLALEREQKDPLSLLFEDIECEEVQA